MNLNEHQIRYRCRVLGINFKGKLSKKDTIKVLNYRFENNKKPLPKIKIIEHFLFDKNNSAKQIADIYEITQPQVNKVLDEYFFNDKTIIIESKMNFIK